MNIYVLIPSSLLVLWLSASLFKKAAGTLSIYYLNIVSWIFYIEILLLSFLGANLTMAEVPNYLIDRASPDAKLSAYIGICYIMIFMPLVMVFTQKLLGGNTKKKVFNYFSKPLILTNIQVVYWLGLSLIAFFATAYTFYVLQRIPLLTLFANSSSTVELALMRHQASRGFPGNEYIKNFFALFLTPFISYIAYAYSRFYQQRPFYKIWFVCMFFLSILIVTYDGAKAPILNYIVTLFLIRMYINGKGSKRTYSMLFVIVSGLILATYVYGMGTTLTQSTLSGILKRIGMVQFAGMPLAFDIFPDQIPFLRGGGFPTWVTSIIGVEPIQMARALMEVYNPSGVQAGTAGVINTLFLADAWGNFGWAGIIIAPIWMGVLIQVIYNTLLKLPKTPVLVATMGFFTTSFRITGGFIGFVWNPLWIFMGIIILTGYFLSKKPRKIASSRSQSSI